MHSPMDDIDKGGYLDLKGLSKYSSLSVKTLRNHLGRIPHYRIGGKLLVKRSEFDRYIEQHKEVDSLGDMVEEIMGEISTSN